ncbi:similar to Saccharomyces cerevisiae YOR195W SLK19 Kinetochore-associated protein required for normal segregation of chromosomes in meiosis and mitosis [Maudiozyma saulgeensis]|uniref:Similar to Saccharomyces cerevisiae YOR195W SLK19 Kinetochore-associated protein required for normal segregation of chromosomes in meiosis and mitosis n=1 Tax=Maudiozyma saulgeensis TaxID=1789683 RepID=A0A1X7R1K9_9SACH|nr:similar to Saccharomyces cerevisiae YOR195W SLK19 Kinetochore-associated protein required for normal segregation of chromosomes in meiosis and mitosis [Kazachstania saulgeensis]
MQESTPTTPNRESPQNDIIDDNSSLVLSPEYLEEDMKVDKYHMKGYNHGLSSKKKADQNLVNFKLMKDTTPTILFADKSINMMTSSNGIQDPFTQNMGNISDMSLEVGRNDDDDDDGNANASNNRQLGLTSLEQTVGKTLEQLDVNKPLPLKLEGKMVKQSQSNFNIISPGKRNLDTVDLIEEQEKQETATMTKKKQKLESPPTDNEQNYDENAESPAVIEMINANNVDSTPELEEDVIINNSAKTPNVFANEKSSPTSSNHMLSPIIQHEKGHTYDIDIISKENGDDNDDSEFINMVSKRNMELSNDIHQVNIKMNNLAVDYQRLNKRYQNYYSMVNELQQDLKVANLKTEELEEENESHKSKIQPLKTKLQEFVNEIKMMNTNQNLLQTKYDNICSENESSKKAQEELEQRISSLQKVIEEKETLIKTITDEKKDFESKFETYTTEIEELQQQKEHAQLDAESYKSELEVKTNQLLETQQTLNKMADSEKTNSEDLLENIKALTEEKESLQKKLETMKQDTDTELQKTKDITNGFEVTNKELLTKIDTYTNDLRVANDQLENKDQELNEIRKKLENANDECEVRVAEVAELNIEIESLKESKIHLEETNNRMQQELDQKNISSKDEVENYRKASIELESVQLKNSNIESRYLKEIGELQSTLSNIGDSLESAQRQVENTKKENNELKEKIAEQKTLLLSKNDASVETNADLDNQVAELKRQLDVATTTKEQIEQNIETNNSQKDKQLEGFKQQIEDWKLKMEDKEKDTNKRLRLLAEDLYHQYSSKHEQKVKSLKKSYEKKYETQIEKMTMEHRVMREEIDRINKQLHLEREEKKELLRTMENEAK